MKRYKVHYKVYKGDGDKRAFSINNGTYYGRLQGDAFWREAFRGLRLRGHQSLAAVLSYLGVRIAHLVSLVLDRKTGCRQWLEYFVEANVYAAGMIICFGGNAIKPSPFGMVVKLPQYLMWIAELEDLARLGRGTFSAVDVFHNGQFESKHIALAKSLLDGRRGGGQDKVAESALGLLATVVTELGNTCGAQYTQLHDGLLADFHAFALRQILEGGFAADAEKRAKRYARIYGGVSRADAADATRPMEDWLGLGGPPAAAASSDDDADPSDAPDDESDLDDADDAQKDAQKNLWWTGVDVAPPLTAEDDAAAVATRAPTQQASSGVLTAFSAGGDALNVDVSSVAPRKAVLDKDGVRFFFKLNADELGVCCRWPWDDVESINVVKNGTTLWLAARRSPVVSRQYREETRKLGEEPVTKLLWSTAASPDPTPNNVATSRRAWKLTASTNRGFNAVYDWLERNLLTAPPTRISFTAGAANAETYSAAPAPAAAAADAAPKPSQPEVAPCLAYPDQCRDALLSLERLRVKYQRHMPADVFDASAYKRFQTALVGDLKKLVFVDFTASIRDQPMFRAAAPPPPPPSSDDDDAPLMDLL